MSILSFVCLSNFGLELNGVLFKLLNNVEYLDKMRFIVYLDDPSLEPDLDLEPLLDLEPDPDLDPEPLLKYLKFNE